MKTLKKQIKTISILFGILILSQSCVVYKSQNFTLEDASKTVAKVKLVTDNNQTLKYKRVGITNGVYYGVTKENGLINMVEIQENKIKSVKLQDKTLSTALTIGIPVLIIGGFIIYSVDQLTNHLFE